MSEAHYQREVEWYETLLTQKSKKIVEMQAEIERLSQVLENVQQARFSQGKVIVDASNEMERLRAALEVTSSDCKEAFAENERLRADADFNYMHGYESAKSDYRDQLIESEAEIERLREALREVAEYEIEDGCPCSACQYSALARAALEGK